MSDNKVIANNIFYLTIAELIGKIFQFFFYKHISTALGTEAFGAYSWATTNVLYFFLIVGAGLDIFGIREIAKNRNKIAYIANIILSIRVLLSFIAFGALCVYAFYITDKSYDIKILLLVAGLRLFGDAVLPNWVYQSLEKMGYLALRNFLINFLNIVLAYLFVKSPNDVIYATALISFNLIVTSALLLAHFNYKFYKVRLIFNFKKFYEYLKQSIPIGISVQIIIFYNFIDILMLGFLRKDFEHEVGIYFASMRIILLSTLPNQILQQAFFPKFTNDDITSNKSYYSKFSVYTIVIGAFLTSIIIIYAPYIINLQFSDSFYESIPLLKLLALKLLLSYLAVSFSSPFLAKGHEMIVMKVVGFAFLMNIALNYLFIPDYGIYGAAYATIFCELVIVIVFYYQLYIKYNLISFKPLILGMIVFFSIVFVFEFNMYLFNLNIYISFFISIFTFAIVSLMLKIITIKEIKGVFSK